MRRGLGADADYAGATRAHIQLTGKLAELWKAASPEKRRAARKALAKILK